VSFSDVSPESLVAVMRNACQRVQPQHVSQCEDQIVATVLHCGIKLVTVGH
jgi:hypothetical protein